MVRFSPCLTNGWFRARCGWALHSHRVRYEEMRVAVGRGARIVDVMRVARSVISGIHTCRLRPSFGRAAALDRSAVLISR
jgi:hypothetical protein